MTINDEVFKMSITELHELKMRLAQQYANGILNKEDWMRADIAVSSIIETKQTINALKEHGIEIRTF